jgi:hypothetical protein
MTHPRGMYGRNFRRGEPVFRQVEWGRPSQGCPDWQAQECNRTCAILMA